MNRSPGSSEPRLELTASPHVKAPDSTARIMWSVVFSLVPVVAAAVFYFGPSAVLVIGAATVGALVTERAFGRGGTLADGSAVITGVLLSQARTSGRAGCWMDRRTSSSRTACSP